MLYLRCPTCKTILGNKQLAFEEGITKICNNQNLTEEQKDQKKMELLDDLEVKKYCCRMRVLTYIKYVEIIK